MTTTGTKKKADPKNHTPLVRRKKGKDGDENAEQATPKESLRGRSKRNILTPRQQETLKLLVEGMTNKQIADILKISVKTVDAHRASIMTRLQIHSLAGLVKYAIRTGLTSMD